MTVVKDEDGKVTVTKDGSAVDDDGDGTDDVIIYGDEDKPDYSAKKNTSSLESGDSDTHTDDSAADAVAPQPAKEDTLPVESAEEAPTDTAEEVTEEASGETTEDPPEDTGSADEALSPEQPESETEAEEKPEGDAEATTDEDSEGEQAGTAPTEDTGSADDSTDEAPAPEQPETEDKAESDPEAETPTDEGDKISDQTSVDSEQIPEDESTGSADSSSDRSALNTDHSKQPVIDTLEAPSDTAPIAEDSEEEEEKTYLEKAADAFSDAAERAVTSTINAVINIINKATGKDNALNITLNNVDIDVGQIYDKAAMAVEGEGDVNIELDGKNELTSGQRHSGLEKDSSTGTLTIRDDLNDDGSAKQNNDSDTTGELTATGGGLGAGIGGRRGKSVSNITITGGKVTANGGEYGAGIGGGGYLNSSYGNSSDITISGGEVTANGGWGGAGIGGGSGGSGSDITITGGKVTANGGTSAAGIGSGDNAGSQSSGGITISGGTITAKGGSYDKGEYDLTGNGGDGIHSSGDLNITGGNITAIGGSSNSGTGGNGISSSGRMEISGGTIETAQGGDTSSNGQNTISSNGISSRGALTINGNAVIKNAIGGKGRSRYWFQGNGIYNDSDGVTIGGSARVENAQGGSNGGGAGILGTTEIKITDKAYVKAQMGSVDNLFAFTERFPSSTGSVLYGQYANEVVDQSSHAYAAGCNSDGTLQSYGEDKSESHGKGHVYSDWKITKEPTCTESGKKTSTCDVCGAEGSSEPIPATGHKYEEVTITAPTCTTEGSKHLVCSVCGDEKENSTQPIEKLEHDFNGATVTVEATCTTAGYTANKCTHCDEVGPHITETPATGHTYGEWVVDNNATCQAEGSRHRDCIRGDDVQTEAIPKLAHTPGEWVQTTAPTCTEKGAEAKKCTSCGEVLETRETNALGHAWDEGTVTIAPTCDGTGVKTHHCTHAGCTETWEETLEALGHTYGDWVVDSNATCQAEGSRHRDCIRGDDVQTEAIPKLAHTPGEWVQTTAPTCTEKGAEAKKCTSCGEVLETRETDALGHDYKETSRTDATCAKDGEITYTCSHDASHITRETLPATGEHTFVEDAENSKAATCEEAGYTAHKCSVCGKAGENTPIDALGHTYGGWVVDSNATCQAEGSRHRDCIRGDDVQTEAIPKLAHTPGEWVQTTAPTCTEKGAEVKKCTSCGEVLETRETDALGHKYEAAITKEATCTAEGEMTYTCSVCGDSYTEAIAKLLHTPGAWEITREATCAEAGSKIQHCASCGETITEEAIPATGNHTWTAWEPVPGDSTKEFRTCEICHTQEEHTVALPDTDENDDSSSSTLTTGLRVLGADNANIIQNVQQVALTQITSTLYVDAKQDTATLDGVLADLSALLASDVQTLVFSTDGCTSTLYLSELAALGVDETQFTLTHSGSSATLTVGGIQHNELIH